MKIDRWTHMQMNTEEGRPGEAENRMQVNAFMNKQNLWAFFF